MSVEGSSDMEKNVDSNENEEIEEKSSEGEEEEEEDAVYGSPIIDSPEELVAQGKKFLAAGDAASALECLQDACSVLAERHGQVSREMVEPYYLYGRALLEVAREKSGVFGGGVPGGVSEDAGETSSAAATENSDAPTAADSHSPTATESHSPTAADSHAPTAADSHSPTAADSHSPTAAVRDSPTAAAANGSPSYSDDKGGSGGPEEGGAEGGEEEESDLKLAWEVLELARIICQRESEPEFRLKLSDVSLALGEVGLECDQYEQAITDIQSCLRLREFLLEPTDRRIAEVYFHLGLAYTLSKQAQQAMAAYHSARSTLVKRKEHLEKQLEVVSGASKDIAEEVAELEELIKDIDSKVVDAQELQRVLEEKESEKADGDVEFSTTFDMPNEAFSKVSEVAVKKGAVNDISHLVRKRKCEDDSDTGPAKHLKLDSNGTEATTTTESNVSCPEGQTKQETQVQ